MTVSINSIFQACVESFTLIVIRFWNVRIYLCLCVCEECFFLSILLTRTIFLSCTYFSRWNGKTFVFTKCLRKRDNLIEPLCQPTDNWCTWACYHCCCCYIPCSKNASFDGSVVWDETLFTWNHLTWFHEIIAITLICLGTLEIDVYIVDSYTENHLTFAPQTFCCCYVVQCKTDEKKQRNITLNHSYEQHAERHSPNSVRHSVFFFSIYFTWHVMRVTVTVDKCEQNQPIGMTKFHFLVLYLVWCTMYAVQSASYD